MRVSVCVCVSVCVLMCARVLAFKPEQETHTFCSCPDLRYTLVRQFHIGNLYIKAMTEELHQQSRLSVYCERGLVNMANIPAPPFQHPNGSGITNGSEYSWCSSQHSLRALLDTVLQADTISLLELAGYLPALTERGETSHASICDPEKLLLKLS